MENPSLSKLKEIIMRMAAIEAHYQYRSLRLRLNSPDSHDRLKEEQVSLDVWASKEFHSIKSEFVKNRQGLLKACSEPGSPGNAKQYLEILDKLVSDDLEAAIDFDSE
jgi:hypothetical protein